MAAFIKTSTSPSASPTDVTQPAPARAVVQTPLIEPTEAARREALAWRRLSTPADPLAPPQTANVPSELSEQAKLLEASIVSHGGQVSDAVGLQAMLGAMANQRAAFPGSITSTNVYFVDMGLDNQAPRGYILNLETNNVARGPFRVAAGMASGPMNGVPNDFTQDPNKNTTELGLSIAYKIAPVTRRVGGKEFRDEAMFLRGVGLQNSGVDDGHKYVHAADEYIDDTHTGRSDGCPATQRKDYKKIRDLVGTGGAVFIYSPQANWALTRVTPNQDGGRYLKSSEVVSVRSHAPH